MTDQVQPERLTLARIHAVIVAISIGLIGQLASVSEVQPLHREAVVILSWTVLLNAICYVVEVDKGIPVVRIAIIQNISLVLHFLAVALFLVGVGCLVGLFSLSAGNFFTKTSLALIAIYFVFKAIMIFLTYRKLQRLYKQVDQQHKVFMQNIDTTFEELDPDRASELFNKWESLLRETDEIKLSRGDLLPLLPRLCALPRPLILPPVLTEELRASNAKVYDILNKAKNLKSRNQGTFPAHTYSPPTHSPGSPSPAG